MKFFVLEAVMITIALACLVEGGYLAWLSATPVTPEHLSKIRAEFLVVLVLFLLAAVLAIGLPFVFHKRRGETG
jgi:hypothetical protein